jgi:ATP-binding cassette subfamily B multidrug efflux pump
MSKFLSGLIDPFSNTHAYSTIASTLSFILHNMRPMRWIILFCALTSVFGALIEVWLIYYAGRLIDQLVAVPRTDLWQVLGPELLWATMALLVLRPCVAYLNEASNDILFRPNAVSLIRWGAHKHIMQQSVGWFRNEQSGQLASRVREIGVSATNVVYAVVHNLAYVITYFVCSLWLLATIDIQLTVPLLIWAGLYVVHMIYAVPRFRDNYAAFEGAKTNLTSTLVDTYGNIETVKLFADEMQDDPEGQSRFRAALTSFVDVQRFEVFINVGMVVLSNLLLVGLVGYAIMSWQAGDAMLGTVAAAFALSTRISGMAEWMLDAIAEIYGGIGATREALRSVGQPIDVVDSPDAHDLLPAGGAVTFQSVSHHYGKTAGGLDGLDLTLKAGEKLALVGPSGAGKSTIVNLLMRHFEPEAGQILVDGQDIVGVRQASLRRTMATVAQETSLLNRSIGENIAFGRPDFPHNDVIAAAKKAHAHDFIVALTDRFGNSGYDVVVGERGVRLSGGQRQRLSLARALLRNSPILILDEATSALDSEIEAEILETLYGFMADKTVIAIAHRLSTIAHMDRIAVIDHGKVAEIGTHHDLLAQNGHYSRLWQRQSKGLIGID